MGLFQSKEKHKPQKFHFQKCPKCHGKGYTTYVDGHNRVPEPCLMCGNRGLKSV